MFIELVICHFADTCSFNITRLPLLMPSRERERERERERGRKSRKWARKPLTLGEEKGRQRVCVCERERERTIIKLWSIFIER